MISIKSFKLIHVIPFLNFSFRMGGRNDQTETLGDGWVILNTTILVMAIILCYLGYGFIFSMMRGVKVRGMVRTEQCWGISLGVSDIMAATLTIPIFLSGLIIQKDFLPWWLCYIAGFIDNLYLAASIWSIVMWSVCRYIFMRNPLSPNHLKITKTLILCVWVSAVLVALFPLFLSMRYEFSTYSLTCSCNSPPYNLVLGVLTIVLSLLVITVVSSLTYRITTRRDRTRKITFTAMCTELPAPPLARKSERKPRSLQLVETIKLTKLKTVRIFNRSDSEANDELSSHENMIPSEAAGDRLLAKSCSQTSDILDEITEENVISPRPWQEKRCREKESSKTLFSSVETIFSDMISPLAEKTPHFRWTQISPYIYKRLEMAKDNKQKKENTERKKALTGSRRTLVVLAFLFMTQVMSLLPIFLLFVLVHYSGDTTLIPSHKMIILMTTLMICNTGFNPVIRIVIKPSYNATFVMKARNVWSKMRGVRSCRRNTDNSSERLP